MKVAVIGAGPSGSEAAARLARGGARPVLFDTRLEREKPCGGGVPWRGLLEAEGLADERIPSRDVRRVVFEAPSGATAAIELPAPLRVFSRRALDGAMLARAREAGAEARGEKVVSIRPAGADQPGGGSGWVVRTSGGVEEIFPVVVGADGARSLVRRCLSIPFRSEDLSQAIGYFVPDRGEETARLAFSGEIPGYLWSFPRVDHLAVGACAPLEQRETGRLRAALDRYVRRLDPALDPARLPSYSALIPSLSPATLQGDAIGGKDWCLIGDAAGTVDPLTREGIFFGVASARMAAEAILAGRLEGYPDAWRAAFRPEFLWAAQRRERFFAPELTERLVRYLDSSKSLRRVMVDLLLGRQPYATLKRRLLASALPFVFQRSVRKILELVAGPGGSAAATRSP